MYSLASFTHLSIKTISSSISLIFNLSKLLPSFLCLCSDAALLFFTFKDFFFSVSKLQQLDVLDCLSIEQSVLLNSQEDWWKGQSEDYLTMLSVLQVLLLFFFLKSLEFLALAYSTTVNDFLSCLLTVPQNFFLDRQNCWQGELMMQVFFDCRQSLRSFRYIRFQILKQNSLCYILISSISENYKFSRMRQKRSKTESSLKSSFLQRFDGKINFISKNGLNTLLMPQSTANKENLRLPSFSTLDKKSFGEGRKIKTDHRANRLHTDVEYERVKLPLIEHKNKQYLNLDMYKRRRLRLE